jgi:hypothetical protein
MLFLTLVTFSHRACGMVTTMLGLSAICYVGLDFDIWFREPNCIVL